MKNDAIETEQWLRKMQRRNVSTIYGESATRRFFDPLLRDSKWIDNLHEFEFAFLDAFQKEKKMQPGQGTHELLAECLGKYLYARAKLNNQNKR